MVTPFLLGSLLVLDCALLPLYSAQESCRKRCGESYYRGHICHCDYDCLIHKECCKDYESMCTTSDSCKGRCGESFKRGRTGCCDPECTRYNQCCPDYQMHCGTAPQTSKLINEADLTVAPTQRSPEKNEDINQDLSDNYLIPLSTDPIPILPKEEIQGDESREQTPYPVPVPTFEVSGTMTTLYPESVSGQEPLLINANENTLSPDGVFTPLSTAGVPTLESEQEAIKEEIFTLFPEDLLLSQSSSGTSVTRAGVSTSASSSQLPVETDVPNSSPPAPEQQSDSTSQSPIKVSESTNPSATPARERVTISPEGSKPTTWIPHEPQATSTTPEAGTAATPGTAVSSPSATKSSDQLVATNKPTSSPTDSVSSTSQDETPAVAPASSPSPNADGVKDAGDSSSTPPSGAPDRSMSVTPLTGTAAQTDPPSSASATGADTSPAGGDITNPQTGDSKPADEVQNMETQPIHTGAPTTAPMRPSPFPLQPSKKPTRPSTLTDSTQALATGNPKDYLQVPNSSSPAPEQQSDSTSQSPITVSESTNPSATPARERVTISPEGSKPTTWIPQEPQATSTTPEASTAATPGTAVSSPSATKSSDQLVATNKPTSSPTDSVSSTSRDKTPAVAPTSSPSPNANGVKDARDSSSTPPSGAPDRSMSVTPLTGTAAPTDPPSSASATGADTSPAGGDITNPQTGGSKPADEVQNMETQPTHTGAPSIAPMRPSPFPLQPSKRPTRPSILTDSTQALATGNPKDYLPVPNSSSPAPEQQSDSTSQSPITVSESTNPSATPARERVTISPEGSKPTTWIRQELQATSTTPEASTAATPGTAVPSPSATKSSDQLVATNKPTSSPTDSVSSTSRDETPAVAPTSSPSPNADGVKDARDSSSTPPSGAPDRSMSVTPLTGTAAQTDPPSSASATGADTSPAGGDITNPQTGGSKPSDKVQNMETQPIHTVAPTTALMRPSPFPLQPSKKPTRPSTLTDSTQALATGNPKDYLQEDNNDTNLCSGRPISGVTALHNGTVVVFRGHYFWVLDANRSPGPARGITETWGIPSPIDTVFTRCHCNGKTYFIKGNNYWRFGNDVMDQRYPKPISAGFDKLAGKVTAALSVPAFRKRRESVYFFKTGGLVQKYTYKPSSACSRGVTNRVYLVKTRFARQTDDGLGKEINIKLKWRGFPSIVTSAVSIPSPRQPDGYNYYIFSRTKYYRIKLDEEKPTLATPLTLPSQQNSAKSWFNCS